MAGKIKPINQIILALIKRGIKIEPETYVGVAKKAKFKCECGHTWFARVNDVFRKTGCPVCSKKTQYLNRNTNVSIETFKDRIKGRSIELIESSFINTQTVAEFKCLNDESHPTWTTTPNDMYSKKTGCPVCSNINRANNMKLPNSYINDIVLSKELLILSDYENVRDVVELKCLKNESHPTWKTTLNNITKFKNSSGCPVCSHHSSKSETQIIDFLKSYNISISSRNRVIINPKEIDIFLPDFNIGIEINGLYWHSELKKTKKYHLNKRELCEKTGTSLLQFWDCEWNNNTELVKSMILSKLNIFKNKIPARKCSILPVSTKDAQEFLNNNHLMGGFKSAKHIGLFFEDELVCMLSYKKYKKGIDISRFCTIVNTRVIGGLSRLLSFIEKNNPNIEFIQYFVDLRYGGYSIEHLGFSLESITVGWWWTNGKTIFNRLYCRANMDKRKLTERDHAKELKIYKIYDAGQAKFIKIINQ